MQNTTNYGYTVIEGTDSPVNIQNDIAPNFTAIDNDLKAVSDSAITTATHVLTGTVHALVRADADRSVIMFTATGDMTTGDTFTVDGVSVTARLVNGEALQTGSFKINNTILAILVGTVLNVYAIREISGASDVDYNNAISGLTATDVQSAIDEVNAKFTSLQANTVGYNNVSSGLVATDVQNAIDELAPKSDTFTPNPGESWGNFLERITALINFSKITPHAKLDNAGSIYSVQAFGATYAGFELLGGISSSISQLIRINIDGNASSIKIIVFNVNGTITINDISNNNASALTLWY